MSGTFAEDIVVERVTHGRYRAHLEHNWDLMPLPQGGIIASFALRASAAELRDPTHDLRTTTTVFAGQVSAGDLLIDVRVLRSGRSATQVLADVRNVGEGAGATTISVFGSKRRGPSFSDLTPPEVPSPQDCRSYRDPLPPGVEGFPPAPFWERVEGRLALGHYFWDDYEPAGSDVASWLRFDDPPLTPDGALDPLAVLTLADRMPNSIGERIGRQEQRWFAPSADLTVHLFEPARTEWILAHDRAHWADDGWASAETTLWDENRNILAYATQMMLFTYL